MKKLLKPKLLKPITAASVAMVLMPQAFADELRVLLYSANTQPWIHTEAIEEGITAIQDIAATENWVVDTTVASSAFTSANLAQYDVIIFNNTGGDQLFNASQQQALQSYIQAGGGYVGIHTASATEFDWEWYGELVGAVNDGHPTPQSATLNVESTTHPSTLHLPGTFSEPGEWFYWEEGTDPREKEGMKILLSLDGASITELSRGGISDPEHPVAWCREFDGGRSFYTVQAHFPDLYEEDYFHTFLAEGIKWAADAVEQDGLLLDLDADEAVTAPNSRVTSWLNQAPTDQAQVFESSDIGRESNNTPLDNRGVDQLGIGSGRPTLLTNVADLNGHNSISFAEEDLINREEDAFDHLSHGSGYTWFAVLSRYDQRWPTENIRDVNAFFGNLRNSSPFDGIWGGFNSENRIWSSTRTFDAAARDSAGDQWLYGPIMPEREYFIAAIRLGSGTGTATMEMFINSDQPIDSTVVDINPNGNPSFMAIGTERNATNHPGRESFDGELARLLIYERPLSDLEISQTIESLRLKYLSSENQTVSYATEFDFESGNLEDLEITGDFPALLQDRDTFLVPGNYTSSAINKQGNYFISTVDSSGGSFSDGYTGSVTSRPFVLTDPNVSVLIGGGSNADQVYFGVYTASGDEITRVARSSNSEIFEQVNLNLADYLGESIYWQVVDNATSSWGFITVDDIQFNGNLIIEEN